MKRTSKISTVVFVLLVLSFACGKLQAQDIARDYTARTGVFSRLYSGKIELPYSPRIHQGYPYYGGQNYVKGCILFNNTLYCDQDIRLDLYKQQPVIFSPANQAVVIPSKKVQKVNIYGKTFIWIVPDKDCGLKNEGFYISYLDGEKINLLCEERVFIHDKKAVPLVFERSVKYYLGVDGKYYHVKNKSDFLRLFPEDKKQINRYAKDNRLDFIDAKERSMITLAAFCDKL